MNDELIFPILYCVWLVFCISGSTAILFRDFIIDFINESKKSNITLKEFFLDTYFPKPIKLDQENFKPMFDEEDWERGYRCGGELIIVE
tara:strand:+ start:277 stop:543 length:267 start_codon:yes stop_codon:yes gene_type:complete